MNDHAAGSDLRGKPGSNARSSVDTSPGAARRTPEVTTSGLPEPASAPPSASMARTSVCTDAA